MSHLDRLQAVVQSTKTIYPEGRVVEVIGLTLESQGPPSTIGELCRVILDDRELLCEVVGFHEQRLVLVPLDHMTGIAPGAIVLGTGEQLHVQVGEGLLGRVLDGLGRPMDGLGPTYTKQSYPVLRKPPAPLSRGHIRQPLSVGVKAIDGLLTAGRGQRLGIFAGSGVGKSTLLGMMARYTAADVVIVALVGERGREVREFVEQDLGPGRDRTVVVAATSDQPPMVRIKCAHVATAVAEYFRDQGADVVLLMDSVTRFAMATREIGLAVGEPPSARGYTPSVYAELPRLLERAGQFDRGSITGFYTVLVEGDDVNEPVTDAVRGIVDGHIMLTRDLAAQNHYPAIDILSSVSRLMSKLVDQDHLQAAGRLRRLLAAYRHGRDLVEIGAYRQGPNPDLDDALVRWPQIEAFLLQEDADSSDISQAKMLLQQTVGWAEGLEE